MGEPKKAGRPPHEPTEKDRRFVKFLAFKRATQKEIAEIIGINETTLRERYGAEIGVEKELMLSYVFESMYLQAVGGEERDWKQAREGMTKFVAERLGGLPAPGSADLGTVTIKVGKEFDGI